ncbi:hypothetical protein N9S69_04055 [Flavobacteriaceae bacterium]|jgi:hypothetical protein|nr:hypothetical protein [Flavobacteriaceae bacterium]MDB2418374.1 hypothetical protein [Flavobacteriaceae bacterium]MDB2658512.1 hypothetical protein [Flavobacteriaceae bacterium]|tara:strand:+ start:86 stop:457 length:372 start_codon:yes stop_codon:yes gene_type:complete
MEGMIITMALFIGIPVLVAGAFILKTLARKVGKIENANFKNSLLVEIAAGVLVAIIISPIGFEELMELGIIGSILAYILVLTIAYTLMGKLIWKTTFIQSFKANIVWILILSIIISIVVSKFY